MSDINELKAVPTQLGGRRYVKSRKTLVTPAMAAQMLGRAGREEDWPNNLRIKEKKYRSIDDDWEDSSSVVPEPAPEVKPFVMPPLDGSVKMRLLKPVEKYYYNTIVHNLDGTRDVQVMCVGKTLHEKMMKAMVTDDGEDSAG